MTLNFASDDNHCQPRHGNDAATFVTLVGLFEDAIDARNMLSALRKDGCPQEAVSLVVRDRKADEGGPADRHGAVAKAVDEADLNGHSGWLLGLASLIVPERGTFLVAGPVGAALAGVTLNDDDEELPESALGMILGDFGFRDNEISYLESRILAGSMLAAVTSSDESVITSAREMLSGNNAVYIGAASTSEDVAETAAELLESPPEVYGASDVVVTDAVAPLHALVIGRRGEAWARSLQDIRVVDRDGEQCGRIENVIAEMGCEGEHEVAREQTRYVVISFGGVLGIGRRLVAVPVENVTLSGDPVRVSVARDVLQRAPVFDPTAPFSRREEQVVCAYFGSTPYWTKE
jgi:hypothetical protein